jgi:hypothetical protein
LLNVCQDEVVYGDKELIGAISELTFDFPDTQAIGQEREEAQAGDE